MSSDVAQDELIQIALDPYSVTVIIEALELKLQCHVVSTDTSRKLVRMQATQRLLDALRTTIPQDDAFGIPDNVIPFTTNPEVSDE